MAKLSSYRYSIRQTRQGFMPCYRTSGRTWRMGQDEWHVFKNRGQERLFATWEDAYRYLGENHFSGNYIRLLMQFDGQLPAELVALRQRHTKG